MSLLSVSSHRKEIEKEKRERERKRERCFFCFHTPPNPPFSSSFCRPSSPPSFLCLIQGEAVFCRQARENGNVLCVYVPSSLAFFQLWLASSSSSAAAVAAAKQQNDMKKRKKRQRQRKASIRKRPTTASSRVYLSFLLLPLPIVNLQCASVLKRTKNTLQRVVLSPLLLKTFSPSRLLFSALLCSAQLCPSALLPSSP